MIKGVNRQVVEITKPGCEYFERVIFFVKPECSSVSRGTLRERADMIASDTGTPPKIKVKRSPLSSFLYPLFWISIGAALCFAAIKLLS